MKSLNKLTGTHSYGLLHRLGLWFFRVNFGGPILRFSGVTDDLGRLVAIDDAQMIVSAA